MKNDRRSTVFEKLVITSLLLIAITTLITAVALVLDDDCCCCCTPQTYQPDPTASATPSPPDTVAKVPPAATPPVEVGTPGPTPKVSPPTTKTPSVRQGPPAVASTPPPPPEVAIWVPPARDHHRPPLWSPPGDRTVEVPEPGTVALMGVGLAALVVGRSRRNTTKEPKL